MYKDPAAKKRYARRWYRLNRVRINKEAQCSHLRRKYGITYQKKLAVLKAQGGKCAICRKRTKGVVDHCHKTKKFRAVLCKRCNFGLGNFKDTPQFLRRAAKYLEKHG